MHESGGYLLSTNDSGFRSSKDFSLKKTDKSKPRVLLFGDSFSAGMGVSDAVRYPNLLEKELEMDLYNFSLPGTGTDQHYLVWRDLAATYDHDLVIIAVQVENIRRVNSRFRRFRDATGGDLVLAKPYFDLDESGQLQVQHYPVAPRPLNESKMSGGDSAHIELGGRLKTVRQFINRLGKPTKTAVQKLVKPQPLPEYNSEHRAEWKLMRAILKQWTSEIKTPVLVLLLPLYQYVEGLANPTHYQNRFQSFSKESNTALLDPLPFLQDFSLEERRAFRFANDVHPTQTFHRAIADFLKPSLAARLQTK